MHSIGSRHIASSRLWDYVEARVGADAGVSLIHDVLQSDVEGLLLASAAFTIIAYRREKEHFLDLFRTVFRIRVSYYL